MKKKLLIPLIIIIVVLVVGLIYLLQHSRKTQLEIKKLTEMMDFEKEQLEQEYATLSLEFDNYPTDIKNDSLANLLENEKIRVKQLLQELKVTKATNSQRIMELKKELGSVREVMKRYIVQIDSLNAINNKLEKENKEFHKKYQVATQTVEQLSKEKENLTETVVRASKLEMSNFNFSTLNAKGRVTKRFSAINILQFGYSILKNTTTIPGMKTLYLRITRPDGELLLKDENNLFFFEDKEIEFSVKKEFEYEGETIDDVIYWPVNEILQEGEYRADFFIDERHVGEYHFQIKK